MILLFTLDQLAGVVIFKYKLMSRVKINENNEGNNKKANQEIAI